MPASLEELLVGDPAEAWEASGFTVVDGVVPVGTVVLRLVGPDGGRGILGWVLGDAPEGDVDGVPTTASAPEPTPATTHPNGVTAVDHLVLMSPDLARTEAALATLDLHPRRHRDGELGGAAIRQVFYRFANTILEVVGAPDATGEGPATLWGVTFVVDDIDAAVALLGDRTSPVKDAVQPGRRITTLRHRDLGTSVRTALITPHLTQT